MSKKDIINSVRGMNDVLPDESILWQYLENILLNLTKQYSYQEVRFPIVESTDLFKRSVGEATDIVEKEMYTFEDRNGDSLTLRPEGTAPCVRLGVQHSLFYQGSCRLWYLGPMFRHERPQAGRYRQFYQFGMEAIGFDDPLIEVELLAFCKKLWQKLDLENISLEINSLGSNETRAKYQDELVKYLNQNKDKLDEDCLRRLKTNPLRILDSKNKDVKSLLEQAPTILDYLDKDSENYFKQVCELLDNLKIDYNINPKLVRGLDYYTNIVFEWTTDELGSQGTICAGGRYDNLVEDLGGNATPSVGFSIGMERLLLLLQKQVENNQLSEKLESPADIYIIHTGEQAKIKSLELAEIIRDINSSIKVRLHIGAGSFKSQFKKADKSCASIAFILGDDEVMNNKISIKFLREKADQQVIDISNLDTFLEKNIK
tara:strand:- start:6124 stop:7416 length:1293 start_codon:yes stop_codon:yes gene_type:complete